MSHKFISKTLAIVSTFALILGSFGTISAQAQTNVSLPSCFISGNGGTVANISMSVGQLCIDDGKIKKLFKECKGSEATSSFDFSRCIKNASKSEIAAQFSVQAGTLNVCPNAGTGNCTSVNVGADAGGAAAGGTVPGGGRTNVNGTASAGGTGVTGSGRTGGGAGSGRTGTRTGDARIDAQTDLDILARHCGDSGDLNGYDVTRSTDLDNIVDQLKNYAPNCTGDGCINLTALKTAMNTALNSCHNSCVHIALDGTANNACFWHSLTGSGHFQNENEFCGVLTANETDTRVNDFLAAYPGNQNDCKTLSGRNTDAGAVCKAMLGDPGCAQVMRSDAFNCDGFKTAADAYYTALAAYNQLLADQKILNGPSDSRKCKIASASDATRAFDQRDSVSIKCLIDLQASCAVALENAQTRYETVVANQRTWCPTCNQNQQSTTCMYGGTCTGGVSKTAQVLNGIANIGGQLVTPLALGFMNMSMNNKSLAACTANNTALIAAQQAQANSTIDLYKNVGLTGPINPITAGGCGVGGFGMGGFGGMTGMNGMGGYNPYGGLGMGGMGISPFGGMPGMTGYNPYGMGMGGGLNMGLGLGMPGMGMGMGMGGGLNMGLGLGMPGMGMGMGTGYNPMMGGNQYGLGLGMGMGGGIPGLGMGTGYNPMMGGSQYGLGMPGMGGMGMQSPYGLGMNGQIPGLYQNNAYQSQANMSSVMQQMAMQNQLIGASGYQQNPFMMSSGMSQYNPYAMMGYGGGGYGGYGNGLGFSAGINIGLPSISAGIGSYNPYSAYGYQGSSCGFYTAGVPCSGY